MFNRYKVIAISNFGDETVSDKLIKEGFLFRSSALKLANKLNDEADEMGMYFYKAVPTSYKLWRGMSDLVGED